jgi:hypothetical protein
LPRDERVQGIFFFELAAIERLIWSFDLDGNGRLTFLADWELLVVSFD